MTICVANTEYVVNSGLFLPAWIGSADCSERGRLIRYVSRQPLSHYFVQMSNDQAGDDLELSIWTSAEPSIAIISACLPTLRPLFRAASPLLYNVSSLFRSQVSSQRHEYDIELKYVGGGETRGPDFSERAEWANKSYINQPTSAVTRNTITASGNPDPDPERDEVLLSDVNVQQRAIILGRYLVV